MNSRDRSLEALGDALLAFGLPLSGPITVFVAGIALLAFGISVDAASGVGWTFFVASTSLLGVFATASFAPSIVPYAGTYRWSVRMAAGALGLLGLLLAGMATDVWSDQSSSPPSHSRHLGEAAALAFSVGAMMLGAWLGLRIGGRSQGLSVPSNKQMQA